MIMKLQNKYLINTPYGFQPFDGITKNIKECVEIILENQQHIKCSVDHPFVINNNIIRVFDLQIGDFLQTKQGLKKIIQIKKIGKQICYDLINVGQKHVFYANNIITHNSFLGSVTTLLNGKLIQKYKNEFKENNGQFIQLHKDYPQTTVKIYYPPQQNRAYIIGVDPSTGTDNDFQALTIWDITNTYDIKMTASFYQNNIPPKIFAYIICKLANIYNMAYVAMQNNGVSYATLDYLFREFEYQNVVHIGGDPRKSIGIASTGQRKFQACMNFKQIFQNPLRKIQINDGRLIDQMERFERHNRSGKTPTYYATSGHDDLIMCSIWAFYILKPEYLERYYNIINFINDKFGKQIPLFVTSTEQVNQQQIKHLDEIFNNIPNYNISVNELQKNLNISKQLAQYNIISAQNDQQKETQYKDQQNFQFQGFFG